MAAIYSKEMLPEPSAEQQAVIGAMHRGNNAIVDSVAGSGKTTTSLLLASQLPDKRIVLITYNRRLKEETRERVDAQDITNLEVHSYHSMGVISCASSKMKISANNAFLGRSFSRKIVRKSISVKQGSL